MMEAALRVSLILWVQTSRSPRSLLISGIRTSPAAFMAPLTSGRDGTSSPPPESARDCAALWDGKPSCIPGAAEVAGRQSGCRRPCRRRVCLSSSPPWRQSRGPWWTSAETTGRCCPECYWRSTLRRRDPKRGRGSCRAPWFSAEGIEPSPRTWWWWRRKTIILFSWGKRLKTLSGNVSTSSLKKCQMRWMAWVKEGGKPFSVRWRHLIGRGTWWFMTSGRNVNFKLEHDPQLITQNLVYSPNCDSSFSHFNRKQLHNILRILKISTFPKRCVKRSQRLLSDPYTVASVSSPLGLGPPPTPNT